jgi:hypothetical protein
MIMIGLGLVAIDGRLFLKIKGGNQVRS